MDKIVNCKKAVNSDTVTYWIETEDGLKYRVVSRTHMDKRFYTEAIYFIARGIPHALRQVTLPINKMPDPDFKNFIEGAGQSN